MAVVNLSTGPPIQMTIIKTDPKLLMSRVKADQQYTLRIRYVPVPPAVESDTQTLYIPSEYQELLYYKFVEKVALTMGEDSLVATYRALYEGQLGKDRFHADQGHLRVNKLRFSWL